MFKEEISRRTREETSLPSTEEPSSKMMKGEEVEVRVWARRKPRASAAAGVSVAADRNSAGFGLTKGA